MIAAAEGSRAFERKHIGSLFDNTEHVVIAFRIITHHTTGIRREEPASRAGADGFLGFLNGTRKGCGIRLWTLQQPNRHAFGTARTNSRESLELADEFSNRFRKIGADHLRDEVS